MDNAHTNLVNNLLVELGKRPHLGKWWKNNTGVITSDTGVTIRYGLPGSPDIVGLLSKGTWCGIEVKTGTGRQSPIQKNFERMIIEYHGIYLLCRDIPSILTQLEKLNGAQ